MVILPEPAPDVFVNDRVDRAKQVFRRGPGIMAYKRGNDALQHHHDKPGAQASPGDVTDAKPAPAIEGQDIVIVATDFCRRKHDSGNIEPFGLQALRQIEV